MKSFCLVCFSFMLWSTPSPARAQLDVSVNRIGLSSSSINQGNTITAPTPQHVPPLHAQVVSYHQESEPSTNTDWQLISELTDPDEIGIAGNMDIRRAWIEQSGPQLRLSIETRLPIRTEYPSDTYAGVFLWLIDADQDPGTGQPHLGIGSEFNVRAVIADPGGGGFIDPTGTLPGGGLGTVSVADNIVRITIGLNQVSSPEQFSWSASSFEMLDACLHARQS